MRKRIKIMMMAAVEMVITMNVMKMMTCMVCVSHSSSSRLLSAVARSAPLGENPTHVTAARWRSSSAAGRSTRPLSRVKSRTWWGRAG